MYRVFTQRWKQQGAFLVFTALVLPLVLAFMGFAVDLGNLYAHKSRLQNGADSAALAGGETYQKNRSKDEADESAAAYVDRNVLESNKLGIKNLTDTKYQIKKVNDSVFYRVKLTEEVPLYFLRLFITDRTTQTVSADAVVRIPPENTNTVSLPKDLFLFKTNFYAVNTIDNPDNYTISGQLRNCVTFNGSIAFTDGSGTNAGNNSGYQYKTLQYSTQADLNYFFTKEARDEGLSVNQAIEKGEGYAHQVKYEDYDMAALGTSVRNLLGVPEYVAPYDWNSIVNWDSVNWAEVNAYKEKVNTYTNDTAFNGKKDMKSGDLSESVAWTAHNGDGNASITIDGKISGNVNDPVYVYLDESITQVNLNVNASNERPVIIVYQGTGKLQMNMSNGNTFTGLIYAPNVNEGEGLLINTNGGTFVGSIIANTINLQGGKGTFLYKDFGLDIDGSGSGSSGGSGPGSGGAASSKVRLVSPDSIDWD